MLASFVCNAGASAFRESTLLRKLNGAPWGECRSGGGRGNHAQ
ncbi:hypothetical protein [Halomonas shantousis]